VVVRRASRRRRRQPGGPDLRLVRLAADDDTPLQLLAAFRAPH
jgi:hypothetical protein